MSNSIEFINIFPNIWICYLINKSDMKEITSNLKKFCLQKNIKNVIRIDKDIDYWNKSNTYIAEIRTQMIRDAISRLSSYYHKKIGEIYNLYKNNTETLIISNHQLEICVALFILFFKKYGDMDPKQSLTGLQSKFNIPLQITEEMKLLIHTYK